MSFVDGKTDIPALRAPLTMLTAKGASALRQAGFWIAIALPMVYLPLLLVSHPLVTDVTTFMKLVIAHLTAVIIAKR